MNLIFKYTFIHNHVKRKIIRSLYSESRMKLFSLINIYIFILKCLMMTGKIFISNTKRKLGTKKVTKAFVVNCHDLNQRA